MIIFKEQINVLRKTLMVCDFYLHSLLTLLVITINYY